MSGFPAGVAAKVRCYVYRLVDPRNGETFYVGRGVGDRVFHHASGSQAALSGIHGEDQVSAKFERIRQIRAANLEVAHVIHRHGLDDATAEEVEAALIDAYPGLTNVVAGAGSSERGVMHVNEIIDQYQAREAQWQHRILLIKVNNTLLKKENIYEAVRYAWKLSETKAGQSEYVVASHKGIIRGVFRPKRWMPATMENFPGTATDRTGRIGFEGEEAHREVAQLYLGCSLPAAQRQKGNASPVLYVGNWGKRRKSGQ
jgi:uncharacterized protein